MHISTKVMRLIIVVFTDGGTQLSGWNLFDLMASPMPGNLMATVELTF